MYYMLDSKEKIAQLDSKNMYGSIQLLGKQVEEVLAEAKKVKIPGSYKKINNIVVLGMGGSALGAHVIKSLFFNLLQIPVEIVNGYKAPASVSSKTLVIASSYSGSTEEVLNSVKEAKKKQAKIVVICSGGKLADWVKKNKILALVFTTNNNPCGSPRMGLGYSIFGQVAILANVGLGAV
jgi:glucose/mannose-6-phosphate isomerase